MRQKNLLLILAATVLLIISGCSTPEPVVERDPQPVEQPDPEIDRELSEADIRDDLDGFERTLFDYRSSLSDQFATITNDVPEAFQQDASYLTLGEDVAGYRVQILSTREVALADSTMDDFRVWASENLDEESSVDVYIYFRQPYYRVRAGDFRNRDKAIEFARIAKQKYPDAWVVHDRINTENISN